MPQSHAPIWVVAHLLLHYETGEWPTEDVRTLLKLLKTNSLRLWDLHWEQESVSYSHLRATVGPSQLPYTAETTDSEATQAQSKSLLDVLSPLERLLSHRCVKCTVETFMISTDMA